MAEQMLTRKVNANLFAAEYISVSLQDRDRFVFCFSDQTSNLALPLNNQNVIGF